MHKIWKRIGCFASVLEKIPAQLAENVSKKTKFPLIGIGAGNHVDGQVLVLHDLIGLTNEFNPGFLRRYLDLNTSIKDAVSRYIDDVKSESFPNKDEMYWILVNIIYEDNHLIIINKALENFLSLTKQKIFLY